MNITSQRKFEIWTNLFKIIIQGYPEERKVKLTYSNEIKSDIEECMLTEI